jgi:hypothetical protein
MSERPWAPNAPSLSISHTRVRIFSAPQAMVVLSAASIGSATLYGMLAQTDPLCKYQVDVTGESASELPMGALRPGSACVTHCVLPSHLNVCIHNLRESLRTATRAVRFQYAGFTSALSRAFTFQYGTRNQSSH